MPDTLSGKVEQAQNFLEDLGALARSDGKRLHATFSVVEGCNDYHAHFALSWLPLIGGYKKTAKSGNKRIARHTVTRLLDENFFYVDNPTEAIKRVTHDKRYVTDYVIHQPKDGQAALFSDFYIHPDFVPVYSETKIRSYCRKEQFAYYQQSSRKPLKQVIPLLILISWMTSFVISIILLTLF